jgi:pimeloyl-ACP methyl ester carboxylesterase
MEGTLEHDGRTIGFATFGDDAGTPVVWCHGGPGSRLEPAAGSAAFAEAGLRVIGIDRPGYGLSTPQPGRDIAGWVGDAVAVLGHLGIDRFVALGISTGGAYALALASLLPERALGVVACCALTDMRWAEGKAKMPGPGTRDLWEAPDRAAALKLAEEMFGADGSKMFSGEVAGELAPADLAVFSDPAWLAAAATGMGAMFAQGVNGYADDRIADGVGWGTFDLAAIRCPVSVIHGGSDTIVPVAHAHHTAEVVPGAKLTIFPDHGHLSVISETPGAVAALLAGN